MVSVENVMVGLHYGFMCASLAQIEGFALSVASLAFLRSLATSPDTGCDT